METRAARCAAIMAPPAAAALAEGEVCPVGVACSAAHRADCGPCSPPLCTQEARSRVEAREHARLPPRSQTPPKPAASRAPARPPWSPPPPWQQGRTTHGERAGQAPPVFHWPHGRPAHRASYRVELLHFGPRGHPLAELLVEACHHAAGQAAEDDGHDGHDDKQMQILGADPAVGTV